MNSIEGNGDISERKEILQKIVQNINYDYEQCLQWMIDFDGKFGYITMSQYIRIIESKSFCRLAKDDLMRRAMMKMDFGCYENFFSASHHISELYQKIFMLIMIEYVFDYINNGSKNQKFTTFIIWEVIAKYFVEEHQRLCPYEYDMNNSNEYSSLRKIYDFFQSKNIDLQDKMNHHVQKDSFLLSIINYFYQTRNV